VAPADAATLRGPEVAVAELADVTDASFAREVLESPLPVLVDFWGEHCPACRQISPVLGALATEYAGRLRVLKIHAADNPASSNRFGVRAMPTVLVFSGGQVVTQLVGARPRSAFVEAIERVLR
jgi:thioredoxin 1